IRYVTVRSRLTGLITRLNALPQLGVRATAVGATKSMRPPLRPVRCAGTAYGSLVVPTLGFVTLDLRLGDEELVALFEVCGAASSAPIVIAPVRDEPSPSQAPSKYGSSGSSASGSSTPAGIRIAQFA